MLINIMNYDIRRNEKFHLYGAIIHTQPLLCTIVYGWMFWKNFILFRFFPIRAASMANCKTLLCCYNVIHTNYYWFFNPIFHLSICNEFGSMNMCEKENHNILLFYTFCQEVFCLENQNRERISIKLDI